MLHITPSKERKELQRLYNLAMMDTDRLIGVNGLTMELWGRLMQRLGTHTFNCSPPQLALGENTAPNWEYLDVVWKRLEPTLMQELEDLSERRPTAEAKLRSYFLAFRALLVARARPDIAWSSLHMLIKDVEHYRREQKAFGGKYGQRVAKGTPLGRAGHCDMLHLELMTGKQTRNQRWTPAAGKRSSNPNGCVQHSMSTKPAQYLDPIPFVDATQNNYC